MRAVYWLTLMIPLAGGCGGGSSCSVSAPGGAGMAPVSDGCGKASMTIARSPLNRGVFNS